MTINGLTPVVNSAYYYDNALTPESMMVYLTTRLGSVDEQIQEIFGSQQNSEKLRSAINEIRKLLNQLPTDTKEDKELEGRAEVLNEISSIIDTQIAPIDPKAAEAIRADLSASGNILHEEEVPRENPEQVYVVPVSPFGADSRSAYEIANAYLQNQNQPVSHLDTSGPTFENRVYTTQEVKAALDYLDNKAGELESTAQMNMIHLQSLMSARQTAISLATNLIAKLDESAAKVVDNIR